MACLLAFGCAGNKIPPQILDRVNYAGDFSNLQSNPESYIGRYVIFGGKIISTESYENHSEIIVLQLPLKTNYRPNPEKPSEGRFIIKSETLLDPAVYSPGLLVTAAGEITGKVTRPVGSFPYVYPVARPDQIWSWEPGRDYFPNLHFGVGVGAVF